MDVCYHIGTTQSKQGTFRKGGKYMNWAAIIWLILMVVFLAAEAAIVLYMISNAVCLCCISLQIQRVDIDLERCVLFG